MAIHRIRRLAAALIALSAALPTLALAQAPQYPNRAIRMVVPYPPGGSTDIVARVISERLSRAIGQPVVVENKPGAGGTMGAQFVTRSEPDGYTVMFGSAAELSVAPVIMKNIPFDVRKDLKPVTLVGRIPFFLLTSSATPATNLQELLGWLRSRPGGATFSSFGNNTTNHLAGESFKFAAGVDALHVPYRGSAQSLTDVASGQVHFTFDTVAASLPHVQGGRLRAIAITTPNRLDAHKTVPTVAESGLAGYTAGTWLGVAVPAGTPDTIVNFLNRELVSIIRSPEVSADLVGRGIDPVGSSPQELRDFIESEIRRWADLSSRIGLTQ